MGGTRAVREEPGKQKARSALFASRPRDCRRGNSPEAAPKQRATEKEECTRKPNSDYRAVAPHRQPGHQKVFLRIVATLIDPDGLRK